MSFASVKTLRIIGVIVIVLGVLGGVGYLTLIPRPPEPPLTVGSVDELETYLNKLTGYNPDSPPGLSLVVVTDGVPFFDVEYPSENSETITIRHLC